MSLMSEIMKERDRCKELLKLYEKIPMGFFGATMIKQSLKQADEAIETGDAVQLVVAYNDLKHIE